MPHNITVVGAGYVGLTTAACFSKMGHKVVCVDKDEKKIKLLKKGKSPIYEPGLEELVKEGLRKGSLVFTTEMEKGVKNSTVIFIAVGTPPKENGEADLSSVEDVARNIGYHMKEYKLIVEKSTVPVRTYQWIRRIIQMYNKYNAPFDIACNPEFLREGSAVKDFLHPDRVIIGVESEKAKKLLLEIYEPLHAKVLVTNLSSAELIKHASNAFLAMKISFINAVSVICEKAGADVLEVAEGIGLDRRIGREFLNPGVGFGGFCFPKDLSAFMHISKELGYDFKLLQEVLNINEGQKLRFVKKIKETLWNLNGKTIGILGLSFKPNTDDMRFAPSIDIIYYLKNEGAKIKVYDPQAMEKAKRIDALKDVKFCKNPYEVAKGSDCIAIVTEWEEFKNLDLTKIKKLMRVPVIIDGRNIYEPEKMKKMGFFYKGIGR